MSAADGAGRYRIGPTPSFPACFACVPDFLADRRRYPPGFRPMPAAAHAWRCAGCCAPSNGWGARVGSKSAQRPDCQRPVARSMSAPPASASARAASACESAVTCTATSIPDARVS
ncbi:hypothetical protein Y027_5612 [Burkholderia pseudomallei TSV5]|nr:hypothetical protein Y027_5612 [Burkholderia pseudomallei TSV5]